LATRIWPACCMNRETAGEAGPEALMRTIVVLLIGALALTPALAHAVGSGEAGLALVAIPVLVIMLLVCLATHEQVAASPASTVPVPAVGGDR